MSNSLLTNLARLIKSHEVLSVERQKLLADKAASELTESQILESGVVSSDQVSALSDARSLRELILRRLPDLEKLIRKLNQQLARELRDSASRFNAAVAAAAEAKLDEIEGVLAPFYRGHLRRLRRELRESRAGIPAYRELSDLNFSEGFSPDPDIDFYASQARIFVRHVEAVLRKFELKIS
jgi:hypothetical protein